VQRPARRGASGDLPSRLRSLMKTGTCTTAEEHHQFLLDLFRTAEPAEINLLLSSPEELTQASEYIHAVLDNLDERRSAAAAELHGVLGRTAGPIIVGWPE
jgi:tRNA A37 methylthiotransferase MiaB